MRILHTADWHLGRRLHGQELAQDHTFILEEIIRIVREYNVDALVHAGDVFDSANPPHDALKQYYSFLTAAIQAGCGTVVITGGNHDSASALNAPKYLLETMNIHVVGCATDDIAEEIIPLRDKSGVIGAYCCAVPFLRDKDLRYSMPGETDAARSRRLIEGIRRHYETVADAARSINTDNLPLITTGHLFVQGGITGDLETKEQIHVGNLGQIGADAFPKDFDYIALGHLHRPQIAGKQKNTRYSGSPIALDFSERDDKKQVLIVDVYPDKPITINSIALSTVRRLVRFSGAVSEVEDLLRAYNSAEYPLPSFAEIHLQGDGITTLDVNEHFRTLAAEHHGERLFILRVVQPRTVGSLGFDKSMQSSLQELSRHEVFSEKLKKSGIEGEEAELLQSTFVELLTLLDEGTLVV